MPPSALVMHSDKKMVGKVYGKKKVLYR